MIIGLCGQAGSGKDTAADLLVKSHGFVKVALADPLKRICKEVFNFTDEQLFGPSHRRNEPDKRFPLEHDWWTPTGDNVCARCGAYKETTKLPCFLTPRYALQQLGTNWGRDCYPNVWVDYVLRVASVLSTGGYYYDAKFGVRSLVGVGEMMQSKTSIVVSDVRFQNEVTAIRAAGGYVWRINRPGAGLVGAAGAHASEELNINEEDFFATINNAGSLEDLRDLVASTLLATKESKDD